MAWHTSGAILCDTCPAKLDVPGPHAAVVMYARAHGWHCYNGTTLSGDRVERHLCETCIGAARQRLAPRGPMEDDVPLFEVEQQIEHAVELREERKDARRKPAKTPLMNRRD